LLTGLYNAHRSTQEPHQAAKSKKNEFIHKSQLSIRLAYKGHSLVNCKLLIRRGQSSVRNIEELKEIAMAYITPPEGLNRKIIRNPRTEALMTKGIVETSRGQVAFRQWGEGPCVMLIHGWASSQIDMYNYVPAIVERGYTAVAMDLPAHGESDGDFTGLEQMGQAVAAVGAHLGHLEAVIAHSVGCAATQYALAHGLGVSKVVLLASPQNYERALKHFCASKGLDDGEVAEVLNILHGLDVRTNLNSVDMLSGNPLPILIVHSDDDAVIPVATAKDLHKLCPNSELLIVSNMKHRGILKDPDVVARVIDYAAAKDHRKIQEKV
jgi:pimeloyl-ACP methyl ester carboxylesterase